MFVIVAGLKKMDTIYNEIKKTNRKKRSLKESTMTNEINHLKLLSSKTFDKINKYIIVL